MIDKEAEILYWKEQCFRLRKDVRVLRRELYLKDCWSKDKYEQFKIWVLHNHSDAWAVQGIFDAFEKKYDKGEMCKRKIDD